MLACNLLCELVVVYGGVSPVVLLLVELSVRITHLFMLAFDLLCEFVVVLGGVFPLCCWLRRWLYFLLVMANKKKKVGSYKSQLKQQKLMADSQLVDDSTVLALAASSHTIHAIVPLNSNSNQSPPIVLVTQHLCPRHHIISSPHGSKHQYHGNPFPCINHVFMEDWFDDDDLEDKVVDFDSSSEDSKRGSKIFTSSVVMAPCILVASPVGAQSTSITSFVGAQSTPVAPSPCVMTSPVEPLDDNVSLTTTVSGSLTPVEPFPSSGRNLFASNHNTTSCSKLIHYSAFTETRGCQQQTHESATIPKGTKGWDSVLNYLGPQEGTPVVDYSEANLPTVCAPTQMSVEVELVSGSGVVAPNSGGWEIV
ncbi:hypothetical protein POTOM_061642 [Populus tomentosa]|uniref:Uncharacterized protein n=1 Tax=Populus tomentosa TaxID=118781 RepID=A0A8X7XPD6_POPTO|nr:hypothetical protein POTOM_061642 [Populus tomentosa]